MAGSSSYAVVRDIQTLFDTGTASGLPDRQLLERFVSRRDAAGEAAFEVLVLRHGPMVLRVCHNLLDNPDDAQDAFQATFLVLVRRWRSIRKLDSVGGWLYGVACRVAARARADAMRRRAAEQRAALRVVEAVDPEERRDRGDRSEFGPIVQEEVGRLPRKYRAVVVLCYWEGLTHDQAAAQLGCPLGTVRSRIARARRLLHRRLTGRGLAPVAGVVAAGLDRALASGPAAALRLSPVPPELVLSTITAAAKVAAGQATVHVVSGGTASLVQRALWSTTMIKIKVAIAGLAVIGLAGSGAWFAAIDGRPAQAQLKNASQPASLHLQKNATAEVPDKSYCSIPGGATVLFVVPDGSIVKKGDRVCELDSAALRDQLINQQITVQAADANYQNAKLARETAELAVVEYEEGIFRLQLMETEGNVKISEAELDLAEAQLQATEASDADEKKLNTKRARLAMSRARFAVEKAQGRRKLLVEFTKAKKIKELRSTVEKSRSAELAKKAIWELEMAKERKLDSLIPACLMKSPRAGTVRTFTREGNMIGLRQLVFEIIPTPDLPRADR